MFLKRPTPSKARIAEIDQAVNNLLRKLRQGGELTGKTSGNDPDPRPRGPESRSPPARRGREARQIRCRYPPQNRRRRVALPQIPLRQATSLLRPRKRPTEDSAQAIAEGAIAANFETDKYKTDKKNDKSIDSVVIAGYSDKDKSAGERGLSRGRIIAEAQNFARDLVNEPSNKLTPRILAEKAEAMAKEVRPGCRHPRRKENRRPENGRPPQRRAGRPRASARDGRYLHARAIRSPAHPLSAWSAKPSPSIPAASPSSPPTAWKK